MAIYEEGKIIPDLLGLGWFRQKSNGDLEFIGRPKMHPHQANEDAYEEERRARRMLTNFGK